MEGKKIFMMDLCLRLLAGLMLAGICVSCEEEESPILFDTESNSNPENIKFEYYSPDPSCMGKMYWITAYNEAGEITLKCTNQSNITLAHNQHDITEDGCYHSQLGAWSASVSNGNILKIQFEPVEPNKTDPNKYDYVTVISNTKKGTVSTSVQINRVYL